MAALASLAKRTAALSIAVIGQSEFTATLSRNSAAMPSELRPGLALFATRWLQAGFTRLLEALCMLSHRQRECFRQNSCKRLRQRSDGLKAAFG